MKKMLLVVVALATVLAITPAFADTFNYTFTGSTITATGTLTGSLVAPGEYLISSGTIDLTGGPLVGLGTLLPNTNGNGDGTTTNTTGAGGGTYFQYDDLLSPGSNPQLDGFGLLFAVDGSVADIWGNGPGNYEIFEGNYLADQTGGFVTPEPASLLMFGSGILGFLGIARRKFLSKLT